MISSLLFLKQTDSLGYSLFEVAESSFVDDDTAPVFYSYYQERENGYYLSASTPGGSIVLFKSHSIKPGVVIKDDPLLWIPKNFKHNEVYKDTIVYADDSSLFIWEIRFEGRQQVTTPGGTYDCYKFLSSSSNDVQTEYYLCSGVGLVKKIESSSIPEAVVNQTGEIEVTGRSLSFVTTIVLTK